MKMKIFCPNCEKGVDYTVETIIINQQKSKLNLHIILNLEIETICAECNHGIGIDSVDITLYDSEVVADDS